MTALRAMMTDRAEDLYAALWTDLRRNRTDADLTNVKFLATEADHALSHLRQWMKPAVQQSEGITRRTAVRRHRGNWSLRNRVPSTLLPA